MRAVCAASAIRTLTIYLGVVHALIAPAGAQAIRNLSGFRSNVLPRNDDSSSSAIPIGFSVNFFGRTYSSLYVNNNGNLTFERPLETYVPFGLSHTESPIIAAFFADVDTRNSDSDPVTFGNDRVDGHAAFGVNYFRVGYYNERADRLNTFQVILIDRSDTGEGNFDIEFNYKQILWDLGDAGAQGGGVAAVVGFSNGTNTAGAIFELPGSMQNGALLDDGARSLIRGKLNSTVPGRYVFSARNGTVSVLRIVTPPQLPDAVSGRSWSTDPLRAEGGRPPYIWKAVNWPAELGVTINPSTGVISGTPLQSGAFNLPVEVSDSAGSPPGRQVFTLRVGGLQNPPSLYLIEPSRAPVDTPVTLSAGLHSADGSPLRLQNLPRSITAIVEGVPVILQDAGNGRFTGTVTFHNTGSIPVDLHAGIPGAELTGQGHVEVEGLFVYRGGPVDLDLGTLRERSESCRQLVLSAEQRGSVALRLRSLRELPAEHRLELRAEHRILTADGNSISVNPEDRLEICLVTDKQAPSSAAFGEPWLDLMAGSPAAPQTVVLKLRWRVNGLNFWQRWNWLFELIALLLLLAFIVYGYIRPYRFSRGLALIFVPEYDELDQTPQPISQWRGVRIGFYRNAHACLHPSYRVTGRSQGALAILTATADGFSVAPGDGLTVSREVDVAEWREVPPSGASGRRGAIYRIGETGPYFSVVSR